MDLSKKVSINDPGEKGSLQRLVYNGLRARRPQHWYDLSEQAQTLLEKLADNDPDSDTQYTLLLNAYAAALEKIDSLMTTLASVSELAGER